MNSDIDRFVREAVIRSTNELSGSSSNLDIAKYLGGYSENQVGGVINNIKGITHELYYQNMENTDGDSIVAHIHEKINEPGRDILLENKLTGEKTEIQLKATDSSEYIKEAMSRYPDVKIYATEEVANELGINSTGISNEKLTHEVEKSLHKLGLEGLDKDTIEYVEHQEKTMQFSNADNMNVKDTISNIMGISVEDFGNCILTGGFMAVYNYLKDKPEERKKVVRAGIGIGLIDGVVNFDNLQFENEFDINPLFVAALGTCIGEYMMSSEKEGIRNMGITFNKASNKIMNLVKMGGYVAVGAELLDMALPSIELIDGLGNILDRLDILDVIADGSDILDGITSIGIGIIASKGVKHLVNKWNENDEIQLNKLKKQVEKKRILKAMFQSKMPPQFIARVIVELGGQECLQVQ